MKRVSTLILALIGVLFSACRAAEPEIIVVQLTATPAPSTEPEPTAELSPTTDHLATLEALDLVETHEFEFDSPSLVATTGRPQLIEFASPT